MTCVSCPGNLFCGTGENFSSLAMASPYSNRYTSTSMHYCVLNFELTAYFGEKKKKDTDT